MLYLSSHDYQCHLFRIGEGVQAFPCSENLAFACQARGAFPFPVPKRSQFFYFMFSILHPIPSIFGAKKVGQKDILLWPNDNLRSRIHLFADHKRWPKKVATHIFCFGPMII